MATDNVNKHDGIDILGLHLVLHSSAWNKLFVAHRVNSSTVVVDLVASFIVSTAGGV